MTSIKIDKIYIGLILLIIASVIGLINNNNYGISLFRSRRRIHFGEKIQSRYSIQKMF